MSGPYAGLKVLDLTHVIAGPLATRMLADLGADVIKVESPAGDVMRELPIAYDDGMTTAFAQYNCGKRAIGLDLKHPDGMRTARSLVEWADVVAENLRPGALDRLGLSWEAIHELNPRAILLSLSLFGRDGPYAQIAGHGAVAEAYSGLMALTGSEGGPPSHFGTPLADMNAGVQAVGALGAALYRRSQTGEGSLVDISSFDGLFFLIDQAYGQAELTGGTRDYGRYGVKHPQTVPSGVLATANGESIVFSAVGDAAWRTFAEVMGQPELGHDERYAEIESRIANRIAIYELIDAWGATFPDAQTLVDHLAGFRLPAARIRSIAENLDDPHLRFRGTLQEVEFGDAGTHLVQSTPFVISGAEVGPRSGPPRRGEHTGEVLRDVLGLSDEAITELQATGAAF
jgi:crotonobetainyl-CoA:carnitine CoA-transferase CaiB-like acyl-CoA transferase